MNSQFKNSSFGSVVYIGIIVIIALGLVLISWYMFSGYKIGTYSADTIIGSVYIGGLHEEDIDKRVYDREDSWKEDETIVFQLTYQGYSYEFDRDLLVFNLEVSKERIVDGQTNTLYAQYQNTDTVTDRADTISEITNLAFLDHVKDNVDFDRLVADMLKDAGLMKTFSSKAIEDYLIDPTLSYVEISSINFNIPEGVDVDLLISGIEGVYDDEYIDINSKELFDIVTELGETLKDSELTIISSAMLELSLATNFSIHEFHYNSDTRAKVNKVVGNSFSIYNPNDSGYMFKIERVDVNTAKLVLVGLPFVNSITVATEETVVPYISQYSVDSSLSQVGENGKIVIVHRTIVGINSNELKSKDILFEFYPPVIEITTDPVAEGND